MSARDSNKSSLPLLPTTDVNDNPTEQSSSKFPKIKINFEPTITVEELLNKKKPERLSKPPNAFMIYRIEYHKEIKRQKIMIPMTTLSQMASVSWREEEEFVKKCYNDLAKQVAEKWAKSHIKSSSFKKNWEITYGGQSSKKFSEKKLKSIKRPSDTEKSDELKIIHEYEDNITITPPNVSVNEPIQSHDLQDPQFLDPFPENQYFIIASKNSTPDIQNIYVEIPRTEFHPSYSVSTSPLVPKVSYHSPANSLEDWLFPYETELSYKEIIKTINAPDDFITLLPSIMEAELFE
ncbi:5872_t:CDS:2 [Ambispora gerdemannii]|uniref:5872_t:CDS:1 n=1 Tax=Ambispora gerdemannii TaxID=144530 RepID=A0A9N8Z232_9GLOM|nr:5872_t:CDS:2 [Ambispora gerdemannii]